MAKAVSIKKNFFYSSFLTTANYLFTFITYPYVSRVLGVDKIGAVNFVDSVINYFIMLSMLGVAIVGIREIAKNKNDRLELDCAFSSLFALNAGFTIVALLALGVTYLLMPSLQSYGHLILVGVFKLIANLFLMDWFFKGMENFKVITIRTFVVRFVCAIATFLFIRTPDDYVTYYILIAFSIVANASVNCLYMSRFVSLRLKGLKIRTYLAPVFILGLYMFFGNFYSSFNTMFLGVECGDTEVGYFTTATKLYTIFLSLFTAFTSVMMPRMSSLLKDNRLDEYHQLFRKSVSILIAFCLPLVLLTIVQADNIILIISGRGYEGAILPMQICMPLLLVIGYNQILMNQGLMPLGKDKAIMTTSVVGGVLALALCFLLIPLFGSSGSALLWVMSEMVVNAMAGCFVYRYIRISFPLRQILAAILCHAPLLCLLWLSRGVTEYAAINILVASVVTFVYCFILQCLLIRDNTIRGLFRLK